MSFFDAGREEPVKGGYDEVEQPNEGGWDIYADFNNAGPRYSHAFGLGHQETRCVKHRCSWLSLTLLQLSTTCTTTLRETR
jgi:hypothetical protein